MGHLLKVTCDDLAEGVPSLGRNFGMSDSINKFPRSACHLDLGDFFHGCLVLFERRFLYNSNSFSPSVVMESFAASTAFTAFL
jgi:hypothetical protein